MKDLYKGPRYSPTVRYPSLVIPVELRVSKDDNLGMYEVETGYFYVPKWKIEEYLKKKLIKEIK